MAAQLERPSTAPLASLPSLNSFPSTISSFPSTATPFFQATEAQTYRDNPLWILIFAWSTIGSTICIFVIAMSCCWWRVRQSNRLATRWKREEEAREEEMEKRMAERIRKARERRRPESRCEEQDGGSEEESSGSEESSELEGRRLIGGTENETRGRNLSDEELETRKSYP